MILLLGGTSDSLEIPKGLNQAKLTYFLSVVSDYGAELAKKVAANVHQGRLDAAGLEAFIKEHDIKLVIDATHPFATEVSRTAIQAAENQQLPYLRFERPSLIPEDAITVTSIQQACEAALKFSGKIYLTTGSKNLHLFLDYLPKERVVARVLPTAEVLTLTEKLGLQADQIEAIKGPFSTELNQALLDHNQAGVLITKESGTAGGFAEKLAACKLNNIPAIVIAREPLNYPKRFEDIAALVANVEKLFGSDKN